MSAYSDLILGTTGLVGYWRLGEASGTAIDAVGSNAGTVTGATYAQTGIPIEAAGDTAYAFDGVNDKVDIPYNAALNPSGSFTVEAWAFPTGGSGSRDFVCSRHTTPGSGYALRLGSTGLWTAYIGDGGFTVIEGTAASLNSWAHVVATFTASAGNTGVLRLSINGALAVTSASVTRVDNSSRPFRIGAGLTEGAGGEWFPGSVDEVAVYNAALDAATILAHSSLGSAQPEQVAASEGSLTARPPHRIRNTQLQPVFITREPAPRVLLPSR